MSYNIKNQNPFYLGITSQNIETFQKYSGILFIVAMDKKSQFHPGFRLFYCRNTTPQEIAEQCAPWATLVRIKHKITLSSSLILKVAREFLEPFNHDKLILAPEEYVYLMPYFLTKEQAEYFIYMANSPGLEDLEDYMIFYKFYRGIDLKYFLYIIHKLLSPEWPEDPMSLESYHKRNYLHKYTSKIRDDLVKNYFSVYEKHYYKSILSNQELKTIANLLKKNHAEIRKSTQEYQENFQKLANSSKDNKELLDTIEQYEDLLDHENSSENTSNLDQNTLIELQENGAESQYQIIKNYEPINITPFAAFAEAPNHESMNTSGCVTNVDHEPEYVKPNADASGCVTNVGHEPKNVEPNADASGCVTNVGHEPKNVEPNADVSGYVTNVDHEPEYVKPNADVSGCVTNVGHEPKNVEPNADTSGCVTNVGHELENVEPNTDTSGCVTNVGHEPENVEQKANIGPGLNVDHEPKMEIEIVLRGLLLSEVFSEREKVILGCYVLVNPKYCHLMIKDAQVLQIYKPLYCKYNDLMAYYFSYGWLIFYLEEVYLVNKNINRDDRIVFDLETARCLPHFKKEFMSNPYMIFPTNLICVNPHANTMYFDAEYPLVDLEELRRRLNLFLTGDPQKNPLSQIDWGRIVVTGSVMAAILPKKNPNLKMDNPDDVQLLEFFNKYYSNSDVDLACRCPDFLTMIQEARKVMRSVATVLGVEPSESFINIERNLIIYLATSLENDNSAHNLRYYYDIYLKERQNMKQVYLQDGLLAQIFDTPVPIDQVSLFKYKYIRYNEHEDFNVFYYWKGKNVYLKFFESLKVHIKIPGLKHPFEIFKYHDACNPVEPENFLNMINFFHLPCVRAFYDGQNCYLLPSAISSYFLYINIDNRNVFSKYNYMQIIDKYYRRGYGFLLNDKEFKSIQTDKKCAHLDLITRETAKTKRTATEDGVITPPDMSHLGHLEGF
jgi:hypothetical protein